MNDAVNTSYLGFGLEVRDDCVVVFSPSGRKLHSTTSVKKARLFVRGYRRVDKRVAA